MNVYNKVMLEIVNRHLDRDDFMHLLNHHHILKAYEVLQAKEPATIYDLMIEGIPESSAYKTLKVMENHGLIAPHTLMYFNGSPKPTKAWRLT